MKTAEEYFRNKIKEQNPNREVVTLSQELITAEEGMRWAHEFKQLHLHAVSGSLPLIEFIEEIEYMMKLYGNQRYTQAEAQRDKLAEKLDDIMRLGGNDQ